MGICPQESRMNCILCRLSECSYFIYAGPYYKPKINLNFINNRHIQCRYKETLLSQTKRISIQIGTTSVAHKSNRSSCFSFQSVSPKLPLQSRFDKCTIIFQAKLPQLHFPNQNPEKSGHTVRSGNYLSMR